MTKERVVEGRGPLSKDRAIVGVAGTRFPSTTAVLIDGNRFVRNQESHSLSGWQRKGATLPWKVVAEQRFLFAA